MRATTFGATSHDIPMPPSDSESSSGDSTTIRGVDETVVGGSGNEHSTPSQPSQKPFQYSDAKSAPEDVDQKVVASGASVQEPSGRSLRKLAKEGSHKTSKNRRRGKQKGETSDLRSSSPPQFSLAPDITRDLELGRSGIDTQKVPRLPRLPDESPRVVSSMDDGGELQFEGPNSDEDYVAQTPPRQKRSPWPSLLGGFGSNQKAPSGQEVAPLLLRDPLISANHERPCGSARQSPKNPNAVKELMARSCINSAQDLRRLDVGDVTSVGLSDLQAVKVLRACPGPDCVAPWIQQDLSDWKQLPITRRHYNAQDDAVNMPERHAAHDVKVKVYLMDLLNINDDTETFRVVFDIIYDWEDPLLRGTMSEIQLVNGQMLKGVAYLSKGIWYVQTFESEPLWRHQDEGIVKPDDEANKRQIYVFEILESFVLDVKNESQLTWTPNDFINLTGQVEEPIVLQRVPPRITDGRIGHVNTFVKYIGTFKCSLNLRYFPFDTHELTFYLVALPPAETLKLVDEGGSKCRVENGKGRQWNVDLQKQKASESPCLGENTFYIEYLEKGERRQQSRYRGVVRLFVERRSGFFMHYYMSVLFTLTFLSFGVFAVPVTDVVGRTGISVTLLLAAVSFKQSIRALAPQKPYVTWLEVYILVCFGLIGLPVFEQILLLSDTCEHRNKDDFVYDRSDFPAGRSNFSSHAGGGIQYELPFVSHIVSEGYDCEQQTEKLERIVGLYCLPPLWVLSHVVWFGRLRWKNHVRKAHANNLSIR